MCKKGIFQKKRGDCLRKKEGMWGFGARKKEGAGGFAKREKRGGVRFPMGGGRDLPPPHIFNGIALSPRTCPMKSRQVRRSS